LSSTIAVAVFQYVALTQRELLFAKDDERTEFLERIPKVAASILDIANGFGLDSLRH
jgi:hypothetical protein